MWYVKCFKSLVVLFLLSACTDNEFHVVRTLGKSISSSTAHVREAHEVTFAFSEDIKFANPSNKIQSLTSNILEIEGEATFDYYDVKINKNQVLIRFNSFLTPGKIRVSLKNNVIVDSFGHPVRTTTPVEILVYSPYLGQHCSQYHLKSEVHIDGVAYFLCQESSQSDLSLLRYNDTHRGFEKDRDLQINPESKYMSVYVVGADTDAGLLLFNIAKRAEISGEAEKSSCLFDIKENKLHYLTTKIKMGFYHRDQDNIYFSGSRLESGIEIYKYNISSGLTSLVADIMPGAASSKPLYPHLKDGKVYFSAANDSDTYRQLYSLDLSNGNVTKLTATSGDLIGGANPEHLTTIGNKVYYLGFTYLNNVTYSGSIFSYDTITGDISRELKDVNPYGGYHLRPKRMFLYNDEVFVEAFVGTAYYGDNDPLHYSLFKFDPVTKVLTEIIPRLELIGPGPTWKDWYTEARVYDLRQYEGHLQWKQWSEARKQYVVYDYNLNLQTWSAFENNIQINRLRERSGSTVNLDHRYYFSQNNSTYGLGFFKMGLGE